MTENTSPDPSFDSSYETSIIAKGDSHDVPLHRAAARGDVTELSRLLDAGTDIHTRDAGEGTALHHAIARNKLAAVRLLLSRGADPTLRDQGLAHNLPGDDAVICAARHDRVTVMQELIARDAGISFEALGLAVHGGKLEILWLLLKNTTGDFVDISRREALEGLLGMVARTWSLDMVKYLMEELGFDKAATVDDHTKSVLDSALLSVFYRNDDYDEGLEQSDPLDWSVVMQLVKALTDAGASVNARNNVVPGTVLHFTLQFQHAPAELLDFLLSNGADVNTPNHIGRTPVFELLARPDTTTELIERFKNMGGIFDTTDIDGNTLLHVVGNPNNVHWLLASGADPTAENKRREAPLHRASHEGRLGIVSQLLDAGIPVDQRTSVGWTSLMISYRVDVSEILLQRGADINAATEEGWTTLHMAAAWGNSDMLSFLLAHDANVHALATIERDIWSTEYTSTTTSLSDITPLHVAVLWCTASPGANVFPSRLAALLGHGANMEAKESTGNTPLLLAIATDGFRPPNEEVVDCLLDRGASTKDMDKLGRNAFDLADSRGYRVNEAGKLERKLVSQPTKSSRGGYFARGGRGRGRGNRRAELPSWCP